MVEQKVRCPECETVIAAAGEPGETVRLTCPHCGTQGRIKIQRQPTARDVAVAVQDLTKMYGELVAVDHISFQVKQGEIFAFLGPNGAGKTTTVEMIEAIRTPSTGAIWLLGKDTRYGFNEIKERIGILPQEFSSFELLTVWETLEYYSKLYRRRADIRVIMDAMDLNHHKNKLYRNLSGGLKQRVGVAIALVNDPDIVFLDEPTTGLDPKARREVWEVIAGLKKQGKTVFLTTHYMEEAEYLADHIAIMHRGKIIAEGTLDELVSTYGSGSILTIKNCEKGKAIKQLHDIGLEATPQGNGNVEVVIDHKDRVLEILSLLRHECVEYTGIDIRRSNLEEVFLSLTGARLVEDTNAA